MIDLRCCLFKESIDLSAVFDIFGNTHKIITYHLKVISKKPEMGRNRYAGSV